MHHHSSRRKKFCKSLRLAAVTSSLVITLAGGAAALPWANETSLGEVGVGTVAGTRLEGEIGNPVHTAIGIGDFNGDGVEDFLVRLYLSIQQNPPTGVEPRTYLFLGEKNGWNQEEAFNPNTTSSHTRIAIGRIGTTDPIYTPSGLGDINADGFDDIAITFPGMFETIDEHGQSEPADAPGRVYIVYGRSDAGELTGLLDLDAMTSEEGVLIEAGVNRDRLGSSVTGLGDMDGDGIDDFAIGTDNRFGDGVTGSLYIVWGNATGIGAEGFLDLSNSLSTDFLKVTHAETESGFGFRSSGIGDVNGDGRPDALVTAIASGKFYDETFGRDRYNGSAYILWGSPALRTLGNTAEVDAMTSTHAVKLISDTIGGGMGASAAGYGDFDGDGFADFGTPELKFTRNLSDINYMFGRALISRGSATAFSTSPVNFDDLPFSTCTIVEGFHQDPVSPEEEINMAPQIGWQTTGVGDLDGDGYNEVPVDSVGKHVGSLSNAGVLYVLEGSSSGLAVPSPLVIDEFDGTMGAALQGHVAYGISSSHSGLGDIDDDGVADIGISAPWVGIVPFGLLTGDISELITGETYLLLGDTSAASATYRRFLSSGLAHSTGIGMLENGSQRNPSSRTWLSYNDGEGSGNADSSFEEVTIHRTAAPGIGSETQVAADVYWLLETNRTGWTTASVTFNYKDFEIGEANEEDLAIFRSGDADGPWTELDSTVDSQRNRISTETNALGYFTIAERESSPRTSVANFEHDQQGWTFGAPDIFDGGVFVKSTGIIGILIDNNQNFFRFLESPAYIVGGNPADLPVGENAVAGDLANGTLYHATFRVRSNMDDLTQTPVVRARSSEWSFAQSDVLVVSSEGDAALSPGKQWKEYEHYFFQPAGRDRIRLDFDVLNFAGLDSQNALIEMDRVKLEPVALEGQPRTELSLDFRGNNTNGWKFSNAAPVLEIPPSVVTADGLEIGGYTSAGPTGVAFGFWETGLANPAFTLEAGRLYSLTYTVASNATDKLGVPTFRIRLNDQTLRGSAYTNIESIDSASRIPVSGSPQSYTLHFACPPELDGQGAVLSFDYLLPAGMNDPTLKVTLQKLDVVSQSLH